MTAYARMPIAMRQGGIADRIFTIDPSLATNNTSIAKRMKNVWMALVGAMISALPTGNVLRFNRPEFLLAESNAVRTVVASVAPVREFCRQ